MSMSEQPDFEKALAELEALVKRMESDDLPLGQALIEFEQGVTLIRQCQSTLQEAKDHVTKLMEEHELKSQSDETSD